MTINFISDRRMPRNGRLCATCLSDRLSVTLMDCAWSAVDMKSSISSLTHGGQQL